MSQILLSKPGLTLLGFSWSDYLIHCSGKIDEQKIPPALFQVDNVIVQWMGKFLRFNEDQRQGSSIHQMTVQFQTYSEIGAESVEQIINFDDATLGSYGDYFKSDKTVNINIRIVNANGGYELKLIPNIVFQKDDKQNQQNKPDMSLTFPIFAQLVLNLGKSEPNLYFERVFKNMRVPVTGIIIDASKFNTSIQVDEQRYSGSFIFRVVSSLSPMIEGYDNIEFLFSSGQSNDIETLRNTQNSTQQGNLALWEAHGIFKARGTGNKPHQLELVRLYLIDQLTGEQYNSIMKLIPLPVEQPIFQGMRESPPPQQIAPPFPKYGALQAQQIAPPLPKQQAFYPQVLIPANPRGPPGIINSYKPDPNANTGY